MRRSLATVLSVPFVLAVFSCGGRFPGQAGMCRASWFC